MGKKIERRQYARRPLAKPCKIRNAKTGQFLAATTHDVSSGGLSLTVQTPRSLAIGDEILIVVSWTDSPILMESKMVKARVVRTSPIEHQSQEVAVQLAQTNALRAVA